MTQESTDETPTAPELPEGFGGILDKDYQTVHDKAYPEAVTPKQVETDASQEEAEKSTGDVAYLPGAWDLIEARKFALDKAFVRTPQAPVDSLVNDAEKFAAFILKQ